MASHHRIRVLTLCVTLLLIQQPFFLIGASCLPKFHPTVPNGSLRRPKPPAIGGFRLNRYKRTETEAFRPTSPGHSPGIGHEEPPGAS
ncbi:hypothetical protein ACSBR2_037244 [Camellia fascicularis]